LFADPGSSSIITATRLVTETQERLADEHRLKDAEKERQLGDMRRQIEDLKRRPNRARSNCRVKPEKENWNPPPVPPVWRWSCGQTCVSSRRRGAQRSAKKEKPGALVPILVGCRIPAPRGGRRGGVHGHATRPGQERRAAERQWARRSRQIDAVTFNVSGMHGDLQGWVPALPPIALRELPEAEKPILAAS
jgi:hypothetical protein